MARRRRLPPLIAEQLSAGIVAAFVVGLFESFRLATERTADTGPLVLASVHVTAFYLPAGILAGLSGALLIAILRRSPGIAPFRSRLRLDSLFAPAPRATASALGWLAALACIVAVAHVAYERLATTAHRVDLASWAMAAILGAAAVLSFGVAAIVRIVGARVAPYFGRAASVGVLVVVGPALVITMVASWAQRYPEVVDPYRALFVLPPLALGSYVVCAIGARWLLSRWSARRARIAAAVLVLFSIVFWGASGRSYGHSNRARALVEQESLGGRWLLRRYLRLTDFDGDRHAWGFGGRDCNDFDARVHPGTLDEAGDGVDLDCFAGDGAPEVVHASDGRYGRHPPLLPARPSFVLVTIDALRPDHLHGEGYSRRTSPRIDAFASSAVRFREVLAPSSRSIRSIPAMMTGLYPSQIEFGPEYLFPSLLPSNTTIAEALHARGWGTAAIMGTDYFHRVQGFYQGFDQVDEILIGKPPREATVDRALPQLDRLAASGQPFFLWVHLFHVHVPYLVPRRPSLFTADSEGAYDSEIVFADEQFGRVLDAMQRLGIEDRTVVILASDHGEAFGEHGHNGHANTLFEEETRAVLMMRIPGVAPRRVNASVSLIDMMPTVLNLADIPLPRSMSAESLVPWMTGERAPDRGRWLFGELLPDGMFPFDIKTIRHGDRKLHWWVRDGTIQLFDLARDPGEAHDLSDDRPELARDLLGRLQAWSARVSRPELSSDRFAELNRLRAPPRMTHRLDLRYPSFTVLGCDVPQRVVRQGETLDVTCYYRVDSETDLDLLFRLTLEGPRGYPMPPHMHAWHFPLHGRYRTPQWRAGEILRDPTPIRMPPEAPPARLRLTFSVQEAESGYISFEQNGTPGTNALVTSIDLERATGARPIE